ncbi:MAG: Nif3-like dinuclear metal center hexameric protein [Acetivibrionales bacterium]|jgi:dinuclear metal center YbgI/SA1388 family protein|nr:Nif3-like dinuclear metal center hexameric protein [Clostridiaceae bacterium]
MIIKDIIKLIEEKAPVSLQESYDNSGLIFGNPNSDVSKLLICLDVDTRVMSYAIEQGCQLVVSHHPAIFSGLKNFSDNSRETAVLIKAIKNDVALYSSHTNFDSANGGLTDLLCKRLGVQKIKVMIQQLSATEGTGAGRYGDIKAISGENFIELVKSSLSIDVIRFVGQIPEIISKVAVYNGSYDRSILETLGQIGPDALITGDLKYHDAQDLKEKGIFTIDAGHYGTEIIFVEEMTKLIKNRFSDLEVIQYRGHDVFSYI